jgi:hypothetical protein
VTDDLEGRLAAIEATLSKTQAQIAALTRRIYQLEAGETPAPLAAEPPPLDQQPLADAAPVIAAPKPAAIDWESAVGTNWLNRIGVVLLVIGITLFLGYAMAFLGAAGKIAIGITAGAALLAAGYWYEAKGDFRPFSLAMLAGGFAILYATAYAAHAVEASRVIDNFYLGVSLQVAIALIAIWQAVQFNNERAAGLGLFAAYIGLGASPSLPFIYGAAYPLALGGLWLSHRMNWRTLPWGILVYTWFCELSILNRDWEFEFWGRPIAWLNLILFSAFEIRERMREASWHNPLWIAVNGTLFLFATFTDTHYENAPHVAAVFALLTIVAVVSSFARAWLGIRLEAASEALAVIAATVWVVTRWADHDPLLLLMLVLAVAMVGLWRNRPEPTAALTLTAEVILALVTVVTLITFPESKKLRDTPLRIHLALPQTLILIACLFAAGRWFTSTPWPSWAALASVAVVTLVTIPKTVGTIVLALEAILAIAAGLYLARRPIRLGGIALFLFSILKVFVYDLSELDTLPRIFSFIVLGLLLIGASWAYTKYRQQLQKYL